MQEDGEIKKRNCTKEFRIMTYLSSQKRKQYRLLESAKLFHNFKNPVKRRNKASGRIAIIIKKDLQIKEMADIQVRSNN